jgi:anti-sigma regulatory factor (Ser/Thr protein kinase)
VPESFNAIVPANRALLFGFRLALRDWLETLSLARGVEDALVVAVHEAVSNGVEHGSGEPVRVEGTAMRRRPVVEVTTKGSWIATEESDGALAERGRGLALMRALTDLELQVVDGCVTIRLRPSQSVA